MNKLIIPKKRLRPIVESIEKKGKLALLIEAILATIWSYRKQENGMYYSNEQLADLFYVSKNTIKFAIKLLKDNDLIESTRRYNSSSIIRPSQKFYDMMEEKAVPRQEKAEKRPARRPPIVSYTPSKEGEDRNKNEVFAFLDANPHFKKAFENQSKTFGEQKAIESIQTILNKTT